MGTGPQTTSTFQKYKANPWIANASKDVLGNFSSLVDQGYTVPTRQIAGFTPDQQQAFGAVRRGYDDAQPYFKQAADYTDRSARSITEDDVNNYLNPYAKYALAGLNEDIGVQNRDLSGRLAQATGGVGADRIAVGLAEKSRTDQLARGRLMSDFWTNSLSAAERDKMRLAGAGRDYANYGVGAQGAALQGAQALYGSGLAQQGLKQSRYDADYAAALANLEAPWKMNQMYAQTIGGLAPALGGTTHGTQTVPGTSPWGTVAGLGLTAAGLFTGNPMMMMGGLGGMSGGATGASGYANYSTSNPYTPNPGNPWSGQYAASGGAIEAEDYAEGGAVNPFDMGSGFAVGGAPDLFDWSPPQDWTSPYAPDAPPTQFDWREPTSPHLPNWATSPESSPLVGQVPAGAPSPWAPPEPPQKIQDRAPSGDPYAMIPDPLAPKVPTNAPIAKPPTVESPLAFQPSGPAGRPPMAEPQPLRPPAELPPLPDLTPRSPSRGTLSDRLLEAGFTTLAHADERDARGLPKGPWAAIGKGGMAALKGRREDTEEDQKNIAMEQKAKELLESAKKWRASVDETARGHDLLSDYRSSETARKFASDQKRAASGNWIEYNYTDPDGRKGLRRVNKKTNEVEFIEGARKEGQAGFQAQMFERLTQSGISPEGALQVMRRPGSSDDRILKLEAEARRLAEAEVRNSLNVDPEAFSKRWEFYRRQKGLPPNAALEPDE